MFQSSSIVPPGHRGIYVNLGEARDAPLGEGLHWHQPLATVKPVSVRQVVYNQKAQASSADLQNVMTEIAVNYRPDPAATGKLYKEIGATRHEWEDVLLKPAIQEITKAVTARFSAEGLIKKRAAAKKEITDEIIVRMSKNNLIVTEVSITDFGFNKNFNDAIEAKQIAEQKAQQAENTLKQVEIEAKQVVVRAEANKKARALNAEGKAEEIRVLAEAEAQYHSLMQKRASKVAIQMRTLEKWDGKLPEVVGQAPIFTKALVQ